MEHRNAELESTSLEVSAREEEIARQNEELQSQTEELERQSEELRLANDELASRERVLAQLLDLSRTLAGELSRPDVMETICEASVELLSDGDAVAILLREHDVLRTQCHQGFGSRELAMPVIPYDRSFTALVIARGQAGYLEDFALLPELRVLQPAEGPPFGSILAAPLWVRGHAVGTIEIYSRQRRQWTEEQMRLLTSMAAQASISLETARLFEEVDRERRRFQAVFRTLPVGVLVCDDPGCRHVSANPAAAALFTAAVDANFSPLAPPGSLIRRTVIRQGETVRPEGFPLVRAVRDAEEVVGEELDIVLPGGRRYTVLASAAPIYDATGKITGGVCAFADITAHKTLGRELEARRREAEEASVRKTRFLAAVSHDIRTPANVIRLLAEVIRRTAAEAGPASKLSEFAQQLQSNAVSLVELVGDVLDLTRFDTGKIELQETEFSLGDTVAEECRQLTALAHGKGLRLECEPVEPPLWLLTDRSSSGASSPT